MAGWGNKIGTQKRKGLNNTTRDEITRVVQLPDLKVPSRTQTQDAHGPTICLQPFSVCSKMGLISVCYGCGDKYKPKSNNPPNDILLQKLDYREWTDKVTKERRKSQALVPTYHLRMDCVRRKYPQTQIKDIVLYDEVV